MDTQCDNGLPFEVVFYENHSRKHIKEFEINKLSRTIAIEAFRENTYLAVMFNSMEPDSRLYMDGLELLPNDKVKQDDKMNAYIEPSINPVEIYKYSNRESDPFFPLIPGIYRILVVVKNVEYHTLIKITPKLLTENQWEIMRTELEKDLKGLAQDIIRRNIGLGMANMDFVPTDLLLRFVTINKHYSNVLSSINDLMHKINYRINKQYHMTLRARVRAIDAATIRYRNSHPENVDILKAPVSMVDYDLPENQWLCRIVSDVSSELDVIIESITNQQHLIYSEMHFGANRIKDNVLRVLNEFFDQANKIKRGLQLIKLSPWYSKVSKNVLSDLPPALIYDPRYRSLYQLYRELRAEEIQINLGEQNSYMWKESSRLYEIWGFLKFCKILINDLGFDPKGWIFEKNIDGREFLIPTILPGTNIVMQRQNIRLNLVYNAQIPKMEQTTKYNPIYIEGRFHTIPDLRIDIYRDDIYAGSVVVDFKYRRKEGKYGFWKPHLAPNERPTATNQLITYRSNSSSQFLFGEHFPQSLRRQMRPVTEVWAVYPNYLNSEIEPSFDEEHQTRFVTATPGSNNGPLVQEIDKGIKNVLKIMNDFDDLLQSNRSKS